MKYFISAVLLFICSATTFAQVNDNSYRNSNNPLYWQNRKPDAAYWQQDVNYTIQANIDEVNNLISGLEVLQYWNNSPDTLYDVFFHLYQNAFVKGSHLHELERANKVKPRLGKKEAQGLGIDIDGFRVDNRTANVKMDNTIMKVNLPKPLYPGQKVTFSMSFKTFYDNGATRRRMQMYAAWGFTHYNGTQWFPKICVYDRKSGWDTYQHLNKEFYGDFGSFDVDLSFPSNYIVEATGVLLNRQDVLPDTLREKLDVKNFANKKWNDPPLTIIPYVKGDRKSWHFHADNVHDFAFTADPSYRISTTYWNGIECVGLVQEPHAAAWQNSSEYVAKIIKTFSENIGMYQYPKMVAADANDGMEYPMLTLDGGGEPTYHPLLVHELGHNWFYGMVGNNETYQAGMDEGFTQFLTGFGLMKIDGDTVIKQPTSSWYRKLFVEKEHVLDRNIFNSYCYDASRRNELPLNTFSNDFHDALGHEGGYRNVYFKTASMLYNLQYVLGDSVFLSAMQHYFRQWRFAHPYWEDFRTSIIQFTHNDLNWFFDEWLETTKTLNYSISKIKKIPGNDSFAIKFQRKGEMQMPIDFTVYAKNGTSHSYCIPNTWYEKNTKATTLPKWYGWGKLNEDYVAHVQIPSGITRVQIDTTYRLADVDYTDNYKAPLFHNNKAIQLKFDGGLIQPADRRHYRFYVRPDVWYNPIDGVKAGMHVEGDYFYTLHRVDASVWWNTHAGQTDKYLRKKPDGGYDKYLPYNFSINYVSPVSLKHPEHEEQLNVHVLDGLVYLHVGHNWHLDDNAFAQFYYQSMWRPLSYDLDYLLYPQEWSSNKKRPNNSLNIILTRTYKNFHTNGSGELSMRAPLLTGNDPNSFNYGYIQLNSINHLYKGKLQLHTRLFGRIGMGNRVPYESALWLAGANPEELMDDKYTRSVGLIPDDWHQLSQYNINHFQQGGGLNLRGYAGYFIADERDGQTLIGYKGRSGAAINLEADIENYFPLHPHFTRWLHADVYGFADAGLIELSTYQLPDYWNTIPTEKWSDVRLDAGVGFAFTVKNWGVFEKAKPLTLRIDFPFFLNRPPYGNPDYFKLRYVIGVNRSF